jgi:hypothetical protein
VQTSGTQAPQPKKRGRPPLPRDYHGKIIRQAAQTSIQPPPSASHQGTEKAGPCSKPSLKSAPAAAQSLPVSESGNPKRRIAPRRRGRPPLPRDDQGRPVGPVRTEASSKPTAVNRSMPTEPLHQLREHLAGLNQRELSTLLLSIVSSITTGAATPAHNWSSHGPDQSRLSAALIGAAPGYKNTGKQNMEGNNSWGSAPDPEVLEA